MRTEWWSLHIYLDGTTADHFLKYGLSPIVKTLYREELINGFFFIRYSEGGPHIRFRVSSTIAKLNKEIKPFIYSQLEQYVHRSSLVFLEKEYIPEEDRYGGVHGLTFAEQLFELSSNTILEIYENTDKLDPEIAIGCAIQMHWILLNHLIELSLEEAGILFQCIVNNWMMAAINFYNGMDPEMMNGRKEEALKAFELSFISQKSNLKKLISAANNISLEDKELMWLDNWKSGIVSLKSDFEKLDSPFKVSLTADEPDLSVQAFKYICILDSYFHMTNNRLGIKNKEESYISYLLMRLLRFN